MRKTENNFEYFVYFIFPIVIFTFGFADNIIGILFTKRHRLFQIGPVDIYRFLLLNDLIHLIIVSTNNFLINGFSIGFSILNDSTCKFYKYISHITVSNAKLSILHLHFNRKILGS